MESWQKALGRAWEHSFWLAHPDPEAYFPEKKPETGEEFVTSLSKLADNLREARLRLTQVDSEEVDRQLLQPGVPISWALLERNFFPRFIHRAKESELRESDARPADKTGSSPGKGKGKAAAVGPSTLQRESLPAWAQQYIAHLEKKGKALTVKTREARAHLRRRKAITEALETVVEVCSAYSAHKKTPPKNLRSYRAAANCFLKAADLALAKAVSETAAPESDPPSWPGRDSPEPCLP